MKGSTRLSMEDMSKKIPQEYFGWTSLSKVTIPFTKVKKMSELEEGKECFEVWHGRSMAMVTHRSLIPLEFLKITHQKNGIIGPLLSLFKHLLVEF